MSETQKKFLTFWTKLLLIGSSSLVVLVGMLMGNEICMTIVAIFSLLCLAYIIIFWIAQRVYLWRIMGILTPEQYEVVKWYRFCLLENGPNWLIGKLSEESKPNEWHIGIFKKIANEVKIPKILLDKSRNP